MTCPIIFACEHENAESDIIEWLPLPHTSSSLVYITVIAEISYINTALADQQDQSFYGIYALNI